MERSHWVLMTKDVIPGSRRQTYQKQCQMVANHQQKTGLPYELPLAIEAATAILMHYIKTEELLYTDNQLGKQCTYTGCQEKVLHDRWPVRVGGLSPSGLSLYVSVSDYFFSFFGDVLYGVAGLRKF